MKILLLFFCLLSSVCLSANSKQVFRIYHDADYSNLNESAEAIKMGFLTALDEVDNQIQGYKVELVAKDHRGNSNRSLLHFKQFLKDPNALLVLGGVHSPPYIKFRKFINESEALLLVPWAAGGPITRYPSKDNWIFRLSVDDTKAGKVLINYAKQQGCVAPHLLLEDTAWGRSNYDTLLAEYKTAKPNNALPVSWFNWATQENEARIMIHNIIESEPQCIIFVGNAIEGAEFVKAMASIDEAQRLPIISHWGVTAGNFFKVVGDKLSADVSLAVLQSCFSFENKPLSMFSARVFNRAKQLFPTRFATHGFVQAAPGFIHGYDIAKLLIAAAEQIKLTDSVATNRVLLKSAFEDLQSPISGLIKTYQRPFSVWSDKNDSAHEALTVQDLCMGQYQSNGSIKLVYSYPGSH
ncbi:MULTISPECIES: ABC transporter substrate-binding protein [unclassified Pseudoalteromonas]|uniref:ABC transporter substrate-binding protein n=1 Tax=unclassified Pseudoalteromonas TaxID=194690 RepID=UPI001F1863BB|nr:MULTISPECIES: ABC transporter substrate-binding protein [unclassified Pseudoalteromonas]MCF2827134.1 ABC transporter substrate-binding protein [Pseudoalteromonas sp. OF5H-5]MCF2831243.1 ABC transporter substrate-binding protein [Pseudoalteromonas sp. DL2-H6]MCF2925853.1 ABC transporter substrate-binding protein [Pseudoalteromonas sp. DL2-H1]